MRRWLLVLPLGLVALIAAGWLLLDSDIGHRFAADAIAAQESASGLRVTVGRIDGSLFGQATLSDVRLRDPQGVFMRVPEVAVDWRPRAWLHRTLDLRSVVLRRGVLLRVPHFRSHQPGGNAWPDYDLRLDRLGVERLTVATAVLGAERKLDLAARAALHSGRALLAVQGRLGGGDRLNALLDAERSANRFACNLDYLAPRGGLLAALTGATTDRRVRIAGQGTWADWRGSLLAQGGTTRLAALALRHRDGQVIVAGQVAPGLLTSGFAARVLGPRLDLGVAGRLESGLFTGAVVASGPALHAQARGGIDLRQGRAERLHLVANFSAPDLLGPDGRIDGLKLDTTADGPLATLSAPYRLSADRFAQDQTRLDGIVATGTARRLGDLWEVPVTLTVAGLATAHPWLDPQLAHGQAQGLVRITGTRVTAPRIALTLPVISGTLALAGDLATDDYHLAGPVALHRFPLPQAGLVDGGGALALHLGHGHAWDLGLAFKGRFARVDSPTLAALAGNRIALSATLASGHGLPLLVRQGRIDAERLALAVTGTRLADGHLGLAGSGTHVDFGQFRTAARFAADGLHAVFDFTDPVPAAGLKDVHLTLDPAATGLALAASGVSALGPFDAAALLHSGATPARLDLTGLTLSDTTISGALDLLPGGPGGVLAVRGGGVTGSLALGPRGAGEGVELKLAAHDAHFGGMLPLTIGEGQAEASGFLARGHSTIRASLNGAGIGQGRLFVGRLAASGQLVDGHGHFTASLAGRRGSHFELKATGDMAPGRVAMRAGGDFAGARITMPAPAVFTQDDHGWRLAPAQLDFGGGRVVASGFQGQGTREVMLAMVDMPLAFGDVVFPESGLGGAASGLFHYVRQRERLPQAEAQLRLRGLSRSGLVLTSRPIDLALLARLTDAAIEARAVASEGGQPRGRMQARITALPRQGTLTERLNAGALAAQLRYAGPADALWRLLALDTFDLTGPVELAADMAGTLANPRISGSLAGDALRLQGASTGTDITQIAARGAFNGSALTLSTLSGRTAGGGTVAGSGAIDFTAMSAARGPGIDLKLAARRAALLARGDLALVATGPIRVLSDGTMGTLAGRLVIDSARWRLGRASAAADLPVIATREINRPADVAPASRRTMPWRFLIDAAGARAIKVAGLGIDSEWSADVRLRGTLDAPAILGRADLIAGTYEFAGKRFDLTRGRIVFDGASPPDPRLDLAASSSDSGLNATVTVRGTSLRPEIVFSSVPALPEEELLSRILFGDSITAISAPEAVQLAAAVASLRSGGGLDPINRLRSAIGLDRLRIVAADAALNRQTGVALGKYLGRHVYAEVVTDGRGYSATNLEFRLTSWLSLLGTVSTVGRQSVNAKFTHDY